MRYQPVKEFDDLYHGYVGATNVAFTRTAAKAARELTGEQLATSREATPAPDLEPRVPRSWRLRHALSAIVQH